MVVCVELLCLQAIMKYAKIPFWEQPVNMWDEVNNVGLRYVVSSISLYVC